MATNNFKSISFALLAIGGGIESSNGRSSHKSGRSCTGSTGWCM